MKLSILIPAYNEAKTIHLILDKVKAVRLNGGVSKEIIIVNDFSTDNTVEKVKEYMSNNPDMPISIHSQEKNMGKGAAIHKAIELATGDYLIVQDADLEYDPFDYDKLLVPFFEANADIVYGSRFWGEENM